jgi:hypothetical protein
MYKKVVSSFGKMIKILSAEGERNCTLMILFKKEKQKNKKALTPKTKKNTNIYNAHAKKEKEKGCYLQ